MNLTVEMQALKEKKDKKDYEEILDDLDIEKIEVENLADGEDY